MANTKKLVIHDNGAGDAPTGRPAESIVNPPIVAATPITIAGEKSEPKSPDTK